jgi:DNA processing protein
VKAACDQCLRRPWLLAELSGHLDRVGSRLAELLELDDAELLDAVGGRRHTDLKRRLGRFDPQAARDRAARASLELICRCHVDYPALLWALPGPPAVLHVAGGLDRFIALAEQETVAIVGTRRPSSYGLDVARTIARGLVASGLTVVSGMAFGIDSAAHEGALSCGGMTIAVLPGGAERSHPASQRSLHRRIAAVGCAVSELPPHTKVWRWMFPARNRLIAGLSGMTLVVEASYGSGALITARWAQTLGRPLGAVPGRVTSPQAAGPNGLLKAGAQPITGAQDVLDVLYGAGVRRVSSDRRPEPDPELGRWLRAIADGHDTPAALARRGLPPERSLQVLSELELSGHIRREAGGRFVVMP